jgi:Protein of unknown function (DUF3551)
MRALIASSAIAAALLASAPALAQQQEQHAPVCMRGSDSGGLNCSYDTVAQCQEALRGADNTGTCIYNPRLSGTTGRGGNADEPDRGQVLPPSSSGGSRPIRE